MEKSGGEERRGGGGAVHAYISMGTDQEDAVHHASQCVAVEDLDTQTLQWPSAAAAAAASLFVIDGYDPFSTAIQVSVKIRLDISGCRAVPWISLDIPCGTFEDKVSPRSGSSRRRASSFGGDGSNTRLAARDSINLCQRTSTAKLGIAGAGVLCIDYMASEYWDSEAQMNQGMIDVRGARLALLREGMLRQFVEKSGHKVVCMLRLSPSLSVYLGRPNSVSADGEGSVYHWGNGGGSPGTANPPFERLTEDNRDMKRIRGVKRGNKTTRRERGSSALEKPAPFVPDRFLTPTEYSRLPAIYPEGAQCFHVDFYNLRYVTPASRTFTIPMAQQPQQGTISISDTTTTGNVPQLTLQLSVDRKTRSVARVTLVSSSQDALQFGSGDGN